MSDSEESDEGSIFETKDSDYYESTSEHSYNSDAEEDEVCWRCLVYYLDFIFFFSSRLFIDYVYRNKLTNVYQLFTCAYSGSQEEKEDETCPQRSTSGPNFSEGRPGLCAVWGQYLWRSVWPRGRAHQQTIQLEKRARKNWAYVPNTYIAKHSCEKKAFLIHS